MRNFSISTLSNEFTTTEPGGVAIILAGFAVGRSAANSPEIDTQLVSEQLITPDNSFFRNERIIV
jgi:hypothetical protein